MTHSSADLDRVLSETLDAMERLGSTALVDACERHPELAAGLRRRIGLLAAANLVELDPGAAYGPGRLPGRLGDFEPRERIGDGAMGVVHRALQTSTGRDVALKIVRGELLIFPGSRMRFRREVQLSARLHHPAILPVIAVGETEGLPWFAMELVRGASLAALIEHLRARFGTAAAIRASALPEALAQATPESLRGAARIRAPRTWRAWALETASSVARAVAHAHENGVLHRDVKPSNVLIAADGRVYLTDFGLARDAEDGSMSQTRAAVGSLPYMAPEVLEGARPDARSDVYGLGALLYEVLTLRRPFEAASSAALVRAILDSSPTSPRRHVPALGGDEEAVVLRALERDPRKRYATAHELAAELDRLLERRPTLARPAGPWLRARRFLQRRPSASAAVALAVLLVVGTPSAVAWSQSRARAKLEVLNADLEALNAELDGALAREREQHARADENLDRAARAVDTLLTNTSSVLLDDVPMMQALRRDLLESALVILDELTPQDPTSPRARLQAASVALSAGMARIDLDENAVAREHLRSGLEQLDACPDCERVDGPRTTLLRVRLLRTLGRAEQSHDPEEAQRQIRASIAVAEHSTDPMVRMERLLALVSLHDLESAAGDAAAAYSKLDEALADLEAAGDEIRRADRLSIRAKVLGLRGTSRYLANEDREAAEDLAAALADLEELMQLDTESMSPHADALSFGVNLAAVLLRLGEVDDAEDVLTRARAEGERLVGLFPLSRKYRTDLAGLLINLGMIRDERGDADGCREAWTAAAAAGRAVVSGPEPAPEALMQIGMALGNLASLEQREGRHDESIAAGLEAETYLAAARALKPEHVLIARALEFTRLVRGYCLLALERPEEALTAFEAAEAVAPEERLSKRALVDAWLRLAGRTSGAERDAYLARALAVLQRAVELGWNVREDLEQNSDLEPLRALPGFPALP